MIRRKKEKSEIVAICNRYKSIFDNLIDCLHSKSSDRLGLIDQGSRNIPRSESNSMRLSKRVCLDQNVLDYRSVQRAPKTRDS